MIKKTFKNLIIILNTLLLFSFLSGCSSTEKLSSTSNPSVASTSSSKVTDKVANTSENTSAKDPVKASANTITPSIAPTVNPVVSGAKNAVSSITSSASTTKPKNAIPVSKITGVESFKNAIIVNLSQGKDLSINLSTQYTKDNIADKVMRVVETSGYAGYVSGIQYSIYNNVAYIYFQYKGGSENFLTKSKAVDTIVKSIVSKVVTATMSDYEKEVALHDYVINSVDYDYANLLKNTIPEDSYTAYGSLIKKVAVCEGYAEAMNKLLTTAGVNSYIINGLGNGVAHEWNLVNIDGGIYHLDATFDDPISTEGKVLTHNYFNVNDEQMSKNHNWNSADYPISTAIAANYFTVNDLLASNKSKYYEIIKKEIIKRNTVISIRTSAYDPLTFTSDAVTKILKDNKEINYINTTSGYTYSYDQTTNVIQIGIKYK